VFGESADEEDQPAFSKATVTNEPYGSPSGSSARAHRVPVEIWATNVRARSACVGVGMRRTAAQACCVSVARVRLRS
jgi:hypothetical protein